jgi:hypothetical protein
VADAAVAISAGPEHRDVAALTDGAGEFLLTDLLPGEYRVSAQASGNSRCSPTSG